MYKSISEEHPAETLETKRWVIMRANVEEKQARDGEDKLRTVYEFDQVWIPKGLWDKKDKERLFTEAMALKRKEFIKKTRWYLDKKWINFRTVEAFYPLTDKEKEALRPPKEKEVIRIG